MPTDQTRLPLSNRIDKVAPSATLAVDMKAKAMKAQGIDIIGFGVGEPNFATPEAIVEAAAAAVVNPANYKYSPTPGLPELRQAIASKTLRDSGYEVEPEQVVVTNGGKQAVYEAFQLIVNDGDEVIIPSPYWTSYPEMVKLAGGKPVEVFAGADVNYEPNLDDIEAARTDRTKAIIVTSPNNPTGAVWSERTIRDIAEWALDHNIWVISDEIYEHLTYDGVKTTHIGAAVPQIREQLIVLDGVAKTYAMPGWRVGWMVAPLAVAKAASKLQGHMTSNVNNIAQRAAIEAVSGPLDAVAMMRDAFNVRRLAIVAALNDINGVHCPMPEGAFYAFPNVEGLLNRPIGPKRHDVHHLRRACRGIAGGPCGGRSRRGVRRPRLHALLLRGGRRGDYRGHAPIQGVGRGLSDVAGAVCMQPKMCANGKGGTREWTSSEQSATISSWRFHRLGDELMETLREVAQLVAQRSPKP